MEDTNIQFMNFGASPKQSIDDYLIIDKKGRDYVSWGVDNTLPNIIYNTYLTCADLQTLVKTTKLYLCGSSITTDFNHYSDTGESFDEVLTRCIFDFILFGDFMCYSIVFKILLATDRPFADACCNPLVTEAPSPIARRPLIFVSKS